MKNQFAYRALFPLILLIISSAPIYVIASEIDEKTGELKVSKKDVLRDITLLAGNELKGRANFSPGIAKAADYISTRFSEIGLKPLKNEVNFKQSFLITSITPQSINVILNGNSIKPANLSIVSTIATLSWNKLNQFTSHVIGEKEDMGLKISEINEAGGKHVVLLNKSHSDLFARYKEYFKRGLTKFDMNHTGAIVIILSDETKIESVNVNAVSIVQKKHLANVVGVLAGQTKPEEVVLYSAHYDHLGEKTSSKKGSDSQDLIYNGADDNASGTTAVVNLASYFSKRGNNARTLIFTAFAAEEIGGFGSQYFSKKIIPEKVVAMINIEMVGKPSKFGAGSLWMTGTERSNLWSLLNKGLEKHNKRIYQDPYPKQGLFYRSDNATLARLGVPAHSFSSTQLDKDPHYHRVSDDVSSLDLESMTKVINSLAIATEGLVVGVDTPSRIDKTKIKKRGSIF